MSDQNIVIDVPERVTPEEAAQLLNAPGESYFLVQVLPVVGGSHRAYLRRYKQTPTKAEAAKENAGNVEDTAALSILRANRDESVRTIVERLAKAGIKRGRQWVCEHLDAMCAEDGHEEEALAYVKEHASLPSLKPKDIVDDLRDGCVGASYDRQGPPIKRSIGWARRKLAEARAVCPPNNS